MARVIGLLGVCLFPALGAMGAMAPSAEDEERIPRELAADERVDLDLFDLERPAVFVLTTEGATMEVRATPDGLVQILKALALIRVSVQGAEGNRAVFNVHPGEQVSVWPVRRLAVTGGKREFTVRAHAAAWAFVVRADKVGRRGLKVQCDGLGCTLLRGQRLDADREGSKVVFRVVSPTSYPGEIVRAPTVPKDGVSDVELPGPARAGPLREAIPGVLLTSARDFPWQSVPLPVLSWEVFRPADVSP